MENLANTKETEISTIEILAAQARALKTAINVNMWQLARVFVEAKQIVPHGQWGKWLEENAEVSERTAQDMKTRIIRKSWQIPKRHLINCRRK